MPVDIDLPPRTTPARTHDDATAHSIESANPVRMPRFARPLPAPSRAPAFFSYPLTHHFPRNVSAPRGSDLLLWRFRSEWLPVAVLEGDTWLSKLERERTRLHPNVALRKQLVNARIVVRWIVGNLFGCAPGDVDLYEDKQEKLRARHPYDGGEIVIDVAYGGIWIVVGVAATTLGLSVVVPSPRMLHGLHGLHGLHAPHERTANDARAHARARSVCNGLRDTSVEIDASLLLGDSAVCAFDLAGHGAWHVLDIPMAGKIRAAVALAAPFARVQTFGWPKGLAFGNTATG